MTQFWTRCDYFQRFSTFSTDFYLFFHCFFFTTGQPCVTWQKIYSKADFSGNDCGLQMDRNNRRFFAESYTFHEKKLLSLTEFLY